MPLYSYKCPKCGIVEDRMFKINERPDNIQSNCCLCGAKQVKFVRVPTAPSGFRLKGEGFYKKTSTFD